MNHRKDSEIKQGNSVGHARSTLSVSAVDYYLNLPSTPSPALSTVTLTPGRIRNIDQDMENLRASRQDNPFIQQVIASRESLNDHLEEESDDVNLMSKELADVEVDPFSLPEIHEHMIRSPPPTTWPSSPNYKVFQFPHNSEDETLQVEVNGKYKPKSDSKTKHTSWEGSSDTSPLRSLAKSHHHHQDRFSLLTTNTLRATGEDSIYLMAED